MTTKTKGNILLEAGTNELEVLVFTLSGQRYGVNVAKVREVIEPVVATKLPDSHPHVVGVFQLRESVIPLVDLRRSLGKGHTPDFTVGKIIVMEFNDVRVSFFVDTVEQIYRVSWQDVTAVPEMEGLHDAPLTSVAHIRDELVLMLDFEQLVFQIGGIDLFEENAKKINTDLVRADTKILLAEDSRLMRELIGNNLHKAGYSELTICMDGQDAWEKLEADVAENGRLTFDLLITDIEMPRIDGLHLTKQIREAPLLKDLPIIVFSSLVSLDNQKKCESVGANAQITKPQLDQLVELIDGLLSTGEAPELAAPEPALA